MHGLRAPRANPYAACPICCRRRRGGRGRNGRRGRFRSRRRDRNRGRRTYRSWGHHSFGTGVRGDSGISWEAALRGIPPVGVAVFEAPRTGIRRGRNAGRRARSRRGAWMRRVAGYAEGATISSRRGRASSARSPGGATPISHALPPSAPRHCVTRRIRRASVAREVPSPTCGRCMIQEARLAIGQHKARPRRDRSRGREGVAAPWPPVRSGAMISP